MRPLAAFGLLTLAGCGYVGDPLPPALNIPQRISDLKAEEVGDHIELEFTLPSLTTEGIVLKTLGGVDLRAGRMIEPFDENKWAESAKVIETSSEQPGIVRRQLSAKEWTGQQIVIGVRAMNTKGRTSGWSNFITMTVVEPLRKPDVKVMSDAEGARLEWTGNAPGYRIFRKAPADKEAVQLAEVNAPEYLDRTAEYGTKYEYNVIAVNGKARSLPSEPKELTPEDTFAPSAPQGLKAIVGVNTVELAWDRVTEPDLRGYRVYRSVEGGEFEKIADLVEVPSFSDKMPPPGKQCWYVVTAFDQRANESGRSQPAEITVQ